MEKIDNIINTFRAVDEELRLHLLLDYAQRLPEPPAELLSTDEEEARVHECMTPVWLWMIPQNGHVRIHARVAEEAPTVKGFLSVIVHGYDGTPAEEIASMPLDLMNRLGIDHAVRMNRAVGLHAIVCRITNQAKRLIREESAS